MSDLKAFGAEIREWLEANCPEEMRQPITGDKDLCWGGRHYEFQSDAQKVWLERMVAKGWTVPTWPKEYGGAGLSRAEEIVLKAQTSPHSRRNAKIWVTISSSMDRRFGHLTPIKLTGFSASFGQIIQARNITAFHSSSLIWKRQALRRVRLS